LRCSRAEGGGAAGGGELGVVSVETALAMPVLLIIITATVTLGHAIYVSYLLAGGASAAARACALDEADAPSCEAFARRQLTASVGAWCSPLEVEVRREPLPGLQSVAGLHVALRCGYVGGVGRELLRSRGIAITNLAASALMPY
jgi:hypothetical protein